MNELRANAREYRDSCLIALTETWFDDAVSVQETYLSGFGSPIRLERDKTL